MLARQRAVEAPTLTPVRVLVDGKRRIAGVKLPQTPVVEGDRLLPSIAAASIIAKVTHDRMMEELGSVYPGYGFEGYGMLRHLTALAQWGRRAGHRHLFMSVVATEHRQLDFFLAEICKATVKHTSLY
jgi:ribonuclease HII